MNTVCVCTAIGNCIDGRLQSLTTQNNTIDANTTPTSSDYFFTHRNKYGAATTSSKKVDTKKINEIFDKYAGTTSSSSSNANANDLLSDEGLADYFTAIGVDPSSITTLELAWTLKAKHFAAFKRSEFVHGWETLQADTIAKMKAYAASLNDTIQHDKRQFKEFYRWLFDYCKDGKLQRHSARFTQTR